MFHKKNKIIEESDYQTTSVIVLSLKIKIPTQINFK